ncbi:Glycosyl hydrolase family 45 [Fibrobacter sp. UWH9]|uniref:glycosyl hydrolase family 5 n=1 Tax=Fibrobacter sp. UWH9 TaxID=1896213 RepID=UPI0009163E38|nr:glycosyl hydrolase family 5 [Fibrobacter sp. UWH9]SHH84715.1 Glycosyl hydrolase family 45 [Fibrobacter sp. UWH9]
MKHPFYKSLVAAGALTVAGAFVACGSDSSSDGPGTGPVNDLCSGIVATEQVSVVDLGSVKLLVYPRGIDGVGKVTLANGYAYGTYDGINIYDNEGNVVMEAGYADLVNKCEATSTPDPSDPNSSESTPIVGPGGTQEITSSESTPIVGPGGTQEITSSESTPIVGPGGTQEEISSSETVKPSLENGFPSIESYGAPPAEYTKDILSNGQTGWNSRYWDACKPHCSWISNGEEGKTDTTTQASYEAGMTTARNCNIHDVEVPTFTLGHAVQQYWMGYEGTNSACGEAKDKGVFTCTDMAPIAVNDTLSYAYVAGPGSATSCGKCFHLQYNGSFKDASANNAAKATHKALKGKHMVVMTSNIGHDVEVGQFDLMVPGGGVGAFDALSVQVNGADVNWGAGFGGFLTECQSKLGYDNTLESYQTCVKEMCDAAFGNAGLPNLLRGCHWFADWFMAADNPTYNWEEVECPQYLIDHYMTTINKEKSNNYAWHTDWSTYKAGDPLETLECTDKGCECPDEMAAKGACKK